MASGSGSSGRRGSDGGVEDLTQLTLGPPGERRQERAMRNAAAGEAKLVKVGMDGAQYELDLSAYSGYPGLFRQLNIIFNCCSIGNVVRNGDSVWEHTVGYLDHSDDWMLVGDLPWKDFKSKCREMRVMRTCDAKP